MEKQWRRLVLVTVLVLTAAIAVAETPTVTVYFDESNTTRSMDRLEVGQHMVYIVAEDFDSHLTAIEYKIDYPRGLTWIRDVDLPAIKIGDTAHGIAQAWGQPIDATSPVVIAKAVVQWDGTKGTISVKPHPQTGHIRATAAPDHQFIEAKGGSASDTPSSDPNRAVIRKANPNPFNPTTKITYFLPKKEHVRLTVYDVGGRLVSRLVNEVKNGGEHTVEWRAEGMASGLYFCRLEVANVMEYKKLLLLK
jgi:hypothetical protein